MKQHTGYRNFIKRAMARANSAVYAKPGKAAAAAVATEPVYSKQATPEQAVEIYTALAEICKETGIGVVDEPVKVETWKPDEREGIPAKSDKFQIVTLTSDIYNGKRIPFKSLVNGLGGSIFPVYMVANQNGVLMQTVTADGSKAADMVLGWHYRAEGLDSDALTRAIEDVKRLKTWQRYTYRSHNQNPAIDAGEIKLPARGTLESFEINVKTFIATLRGLAKNAYMDLGGYIFPIQTITEICRVASADAMTVKVENNEKPALVLQHGNSKTRIFGMNNDNLPKDIKVIPCMI